MEFIANFFRGAGAIALDVLSWFLEIVRGVFLSLLIWVFNYFTSANGFFKALTDTTRDRTFSFLQMFEYGGENILNSVLAKVVLPSAAGLLVILFLVNLYKAMLTDSATESPGRIIVRFIMAACLVGMMLPFFQMVLRTAARVETKISARVTSSTGELTTESFENLENMVSNIFGGSGDIPEVEYTAAAATINAANRISDSISGDKWRSIAINNTAADGDGWNGGSPIYNGVNYGSIGDNSAEELGNLFQWLEAMGYAELKTNPMSGLRYWDVDTTASGYPEVFLFYDMDEDGVFDPGMDLEAANDISNAANSDSLEESLYRIGVVIVSLVICIVLVWKFVKLVVLYIARYVRLMLLMLFAPLAGATYASASSEDICKAYVRMYISSLISLLTSQMLVLTTRFCVVATLNASSLENMIIFYCLTLGYFSFITSVDDYLDKAKLSAVGLKTPMMDGMGIGFLKGLIGGTRSGFKRGTRGILGRGKGRGNGNPLSSVACARSSAYQFGKGLSNAGKLSGGASMVMRAGSMGTKISTTDKKAIVKAAATGLALASPLLSAFNRNGMQAMTKRSGNGKYNVSANLGRGFKGSLGAALIGVGDKHGQGDFVRGTLTAADGSKYSIMSGKTKSGDPAFRITNNDTGQHLKNDAKSWMSAVDAVEKAGKGKIRSADFYGKDGAVTHVDGKDGKYDISRTLGSYDSMEAAASRMKDYGFREFRVTNEAGYDSGTISFDDIGKSIEEASSVNAYAKSEDGEYDITIHDDGSVKVNGGDLDESDYSSMEAFVNATDTEEVTFATRTYMDENGINAESDKERAAREKRERVRRHENNVYG